MMRTKGVMENGLAVPIFRTRYLGYRYIKISIRRIVGFKDKEK
jgi:hypothetical protein